MTLSRIALAVTLFLCATAASASEFKLGDLSVAGPWTRATPGGATVAGGYLTITNKGTEADRLTGGTLTGADKVEIHEMKMDGDKMQMRRVDGGLEIKPGETVALTPGSYHLMFFGLKAPIATGADIKGTLAFEKAGNLDVDYKVEPIGAKEPSHHGGAH